MDLADAVQDQGTAGETARVDPLLHGDVGAGLKLEVALARVGAVGVVQRPLDVHGVGVVALDEVAVIAVHRPHQIGKRREHALGQAAAEACRRCRQLQREVGEPGTMARGLRDAQRLHRGDGLATVCRRLRAGAGFRWFGRFSVRLRLAHIGVYIRLLRAVSGDFGTAVWPDFWPLFERLRS